MGLSSNHSIEHQNNQAFQGNIYKPKVWVHLLNIASLLFFVAILSLPVLTNVLLINMSNQPSEDPQVLRILAVIFAPIIILAAFLMLQLIVGVIANFFSYIKVTEEGIENKVWPNRHIRARWSQVDRLGTFFFSKALFLKSYDVIGFSLNDKWPLKLINHFQPSINLFFYKGWPGGQLAADLQKYAPQLFDKKPKIIAVSTSVPASEPKFSLVQEEQKPLLGVTQEHRLIAALSHASIFITGPGILIPLAIYFSNRKKSAYLSFHALQAFTYQLVGSLFITLYSVIAVIGIFLWVLRLSSAAEQIAPDSQSLTMIAILLISGVLIGFASAIYVTYAIFGAFRTYFGKDFRYIVIGKWLERRNPH